MVLSAAERHVFVSLSELDLTQLTVAQRLELIGLLWDSLPESGEALPIPEWRWQELERHLAAAIASPELAIPWEEVRSRLWGNP
jgi:putative addiction module component (TIGR02574 family)